MNLHVPFDVAACDTISKHSVEMWTRFSSSKCAFAAYPVNRFFFKRELAPLRTCARHKRRAHVVVRPNNGLETDRVVKYQ